MLNYTEEIGIQHPDHGIPLMIAIALGPTTADPVTVTVEWGGPEPELGDYRPETVADMLCWADAVSGYYASYQEAHDTLIGFGVNGYDLPSVTALAREEREEAEDDEWVWPMPDPPR